MDYKKPGLLFKYSFFILEQAGPVAIIRACSWKYRMGKKVSDKEGGINTVIVNWPNDNRCKILGFNTHFKSFKITGLSKVPLTNKTNNNYQRHC